MTLFQYINLNFDRIRYDMQIGIVPCSVIRHFQIYSRYDYYKRLGNSTTDAVIGCCNDFQVQQCWIYRIVKKMETEI